MSAPPAPPNQTTTPASATSHPSAHGLVAEGYAAPRLLPLGASDRCEPLTAALMRLAAARGANPSDAAASAPPAGMLHRHVLECIFAFLNRGELALALRVSHNWLSAVGSMRRLDLTSSRPSAPLFEVAQSAMSRHISTLICKCLTPADLSAIADRMAHLHALHCQLAPPPHGQPLHFPASLRLLNVNLTAMVDAAQVNALIAAIGWLPLLEELTVDLRSLCAQVSFAPLTALPQLRALSVYAGDMYNPDDFSAAQVNQLRALPHLQELRVNMTLSLLRRLLRLPHDLQWQQISLPDDMDDEAAALLPQLPSLTKINLYAKCARFDWLRGLPNLTDVNLSFSGVAVDDGRAASLVAGLQSCTNIQMLKLQQCFGCEDLTAAHLADLPPRLPRLRELALRDLRIDSLSFLSQAPLTIQLRRLTLRGCHRLLPSEVRHVHGLRGLTQLCLYSSFAAPLDEDDQALLTPPSVLLPLLTRYIAP